MACRNTNWQLVTDECKLPSYELLRWFGRFGIALLAASAESSAISFWWPPRSNEVGGHQRLAVAIRVPSQDLFIHPIGDNQATDELFSMADRSADLLNAHRSRTTSA